MSYASFIKRILDIMLSLLLLLLFSWLVLFIVVVYLITFNFPILFSQPRIGKGGQSFVMFKFRTLNNSTAHLDERRFWLGDVLRFFSFDELPQLWNVLRGEMSLIGPRPLPIEYFPLMDEAQRQRHSVRPGITGLTQVNGRHEITWEKKFRLDQYYVEHVSFPLDTEVLIKTIFLLLSFRKDKSLAEEKFQGSSSSVS